MEITINDDLIRQWEPKIYKFLQTTFVVGMEPEDLAQELRIAIIKAAENFDESKGVIFHTYLHTVMINTIRTLISKAQKAKPFLTAYSIDGATSFDYGVSDSEHVVPNRINKSLVDETANSFTTDIELSDILERANLSSQELNFIEHRTNGATMEQISKKLGISAYKIRTSIQKKISNIDEGDFASYEKAYP